MDTKLRNFSRNALTKIIAFIVATIMTAIAVMQIFYVDWQGFNVEPLMVEGYEESNTFNNEVNNAFHITYRYLEENDEAAIEDIEMLIEDIDYIYYISDGEETRTNREDFSREDFVGYGDNFFEYDQGRIKSGENTSGNLVYWFNIEDDVTMYIAFSDEYIQEQQEHWNDENDTLFNLATTFVTCVIVAFILIIYLIIVTGRNPNEDQLQTNWLDSLYSEILLASIVIPIIFWIIFISEMHYNLSQLSNMNGYIYFIGIVTAISAALCGVALLAIARKFKDRRFIKDFLLYRVCYKVLNVVRGFFSFVKSFFDGRRYAKYPLTKNLHQRQLAFIVASFILALLTFMFMWTPLIILPPILEIVLIYWYIKYNNKTYEEINQGFNESLEEQMKSERMKLELITNVSHDLKTPLTSIISYVDLLSKDEALSESAQDYVRILADKSERLKNIVSDLFDLAKSTSGDINMELETLDMKKLIEQTIGDMQDKIEQSEQQIKINFTEEPVNIYTDGKKMYRVFQNVIDNALKYSLTGTRIFVELKENNGKGIATIKNISNYEMDFTEEEILQRFSRGDQSRTTDGSGLGLSIAESFTRVSGGNFKIDIDGDMFKVVISFDMV